MIRIIIIIFLLISCKTEIDVERFRHGKIALPSGKTIDIDLVFTEEEQSKGLSGVKPNEFPKNKGMLFFYEQIGPRRFWMPDTYFNLDIFFLNKNFKVIALERNLPAHPGMLEPPYIAYTPVYFAMHVLEMRSDSPIAKEIKVGTKMKLTGDFSLSEIESNIHLLK